MKPINDVTSLLSKIDIPEFCERHKIRSFSIFGSYASGNATSSIDRDVLVEFSEPTSLLRHLEVKLELEKELGLAVDLLTVDGLNHRLEDPILKSRKLIYEKAS